MLFSYNINILIYLSQQGVKIYGVQAFDEEESAKFFQEMAGLTSGQHLKLSEFSNICDIIMAICYREKGAEYLEVRKTTTFSTRNKYLYSYRLCSESVYKLKMNALRLCLFCMVIQVSLESE